MSLLHSLLCLLFPFLLLSSHIYSQPSLLLPENQKYASDFHFFFSLETPLSQGDYLYLKLPFSSDITSSLLSTTLDPETANSNFVKLVRTGGLDPEHFFLLPSALQSGTWYRLAIIISSSSLAAQSPGFQGCVGLKTTSSDAPEYITYDENSCIDSISFGPAVETSAFKVLGSFTYTQSTVIRNFGASYTAFFDVYPHVYIENGGVVVLTLSNKDFTFGTNCVSTECLVGSTNPDCPTSLVVQMSRVEGRCVTIANKLTFTMDKAVGMTPFRVQAVIANPNTIGSSDVTAVFKSKKAETWFAVTSVVQGTVNGLNVATSYPSLIASITVTLFWGLSSSDISTTKLIGCPVVLYKTQTSGSIPIFNSLKSEISISSAIYSFSSLGYLNILWYPVESSSSIDVTILLSSIQTTIPILANSLVTSGISGNSNYAKISKVDSLVQGGNYKVSGKFILAAGIIATNANCGKVEIYTGNDAFKIGSTTSASLFIKENVEYLEDSTVAQSWGATARLAKTGYNIFHSYLKSSSLNLQFDRTIDTPVATIGALYDKILLYFYDGVSGKPGIYMRETTSDSEITGLLMILSTSDPKFICQETNCFSTTQNLASVVMMKIVFNNNVVNIDSKDFENGVVLVGTIFGILDGSNNIDKTNTNKGVSDYGNPTTKMNFISKTQNFWHVTVICLPVTGYANCQNIDRLTYGASYKFSGISFLKTKIATYPTQYVNTYVFDFLLCFKFYAYSSYSASTQEDAFTLVEGTSGLIRAGPAMWNAYVIKGLAGGGKAVASFVNYYHDSASPKFGSGSAFASYVRINIIFSSTDLPTSVSQVAVFLDGAPETTTSTQKSYESLKKYSDSQNLLSIVDFVGGYATSGTVSGGYDETLSTGRLFNDYWLFKSNLKWSVSNFGGNTLELNVLIPVAPLLLNIASLHIAIYPTVAVVQQGVELAPAGVFRVMGSHYKNTPKRTADIGTNKNADAASTGYPDDLTTMGSFWSADLTATNTGTPANSGKGCIRAGETSSAIIRLSTLVSSSSLLPSQTYTNNVQIQGSVPYPSGNSASSDFCRISVGNDLTSALLESSDLSDGSFKIGSVFAIYSRDNIFASGGASLVWSHTNTGQNKCIYHNFCLGGASCAMVWTIICQTDKPNVGTANYGTTSSSVTFSSFTVPFYWGNKFNIASKLQYVWSGNTGLGAFVGKDPSSTLTWILKTCTVNTNSGIQKDTMDTSYSLTITNSVSYQLAEASASSGYSITVQEKFMTSADAATALKPAYCEFPGNAKISCDLSGNTYILKNTDSNKILLTSLVINVIVDTVGALTTSHWVTLIYNSAEIEYCSESTAIQFSIDATKLSTVILLNDFKYSNMKGAKGSFYLTFTMGRTIRKGNVFLFNFGFFAYPTTSTKNYKCLILNSDGQISTNFLTISSTNLLAATATVKTNMLTGGSFRFKCQGGLTTDYSTNVQEPISAKYYTSLGGRTLTDIATTETKISAGLIPTDSVTITSASLSKLYKTRGFESDYILKFTVNATEIGYSGRMFIEFTKCIPPKLNYAGVLECLINEVPAYCEFVEDRRVSVWPNIIITKGQTVNLIISGVTQPNPSDVDAVTPQVYIALDTNDNVFDGISEHVFIPEDFDQSTALPGIIYMHDLSVSQNKIRSTTNIVMVIGLPANTVLLNSYIYIQFPASLASSLFYSSSFSCSVKRIADPVLQEFASSCSLLRGRKAVIRFFTDSLNAIGLNYTITISGILTPQYSSLGDLRSDMKVFLTSDNKTITYTTAIGNRNSSSFLRWDENVGILLDWVGSEGKKVEKYLDVAVGYYKTKAGIVTNSRGNFNNTFKWQFSGLNTTSFLTHQDFTVTSSLQIKTGYPISNFWIAAKETAAIGKYYLSTQKYEDNYNIYSPLPFLDIRVINDQCQIVPSTNILTIPLNGYSIPLVIDFSNCVPVTEISVTANLTNTNGLTLEFANGKSAQTQSLKFDANTKNYQLYFYLKSTDIFNNNTIGSAAASLTLYGVDSPFYKISPTFTINVVPSFSEPPVLQNIVVSSMPGSANLGFSCSQSGKIYFGVGVKKSALGLGLEEIAKKSEGVNLRVSKLDSEDPDYKLFGFLNYPQANIYQSIVLSNNLKAGESYSVIAYCINQMSNYGNANATANWNQLDNQGKTVAIQFVFKNSEMLTATQKVDLACGLTRFFAIPSSRVKTDEGFSCIGLRAMQTTNQTTVNTSSSYAVYSRYYWFIIKDYLSASDSFHQEVQSKMQDSSFGLNVLKNTNLGLNGFPVINSTSNMIIDAYSLQGNAVPNVVMSKEINYYSWVACNISLTNVRGYVYVGLGKNGTKIPSANQLRQGLDGDGQYLLARFYKDLYSNEIADFNFTRLQSKMNFTLYWVGSNLDGSINSLVSTTEYRNVWTTEYIANFGLKIEVVLIFVMLIIFVMLA